MIVADIPAAQLRQLLAGPGLGLRTGPVVSRIRSRVAEVAHGIALHYARHSVVDDDAFADFHVSVERPGNLRRWFGPQVEFRLDGQKTFLPLPGAQGFPMLEWGLNWCIYANCHQFLTLHSAVLEKGGRALLLPAPSGSGKSTLCAGLAFRGWRLLSDEMAVIAPASGELLAVPRPISLKNRSVDVMRRFAPDAVFGPVVPDTIKGSVCHVQPPPDAVLRATERAVPRWIVLPRYEEGAPARLTPLPRAKAFMALVEQTFNYEAHGREGFVTLADLVERCEAYEFSYGQLDEAVQLFDRLAAQSAS